jgi:hypothetical protein
VAARPEGSKPLQAELEAHARALQEFIASAESIEPSDWNLPRQTDKWSPAQVAEHLRLAYSTVRSELSGQGGVRVRTKWWQQRLFKVLYLPRILRTGRFPTGVRATREMRPTGGAFDKEHLLGALRQEGERFMEEVGRATDRARITHPYLGKLSIVDGLRFATQHIRHHHSQIVGVSGPAA